MLTFLQYQFYLANAADYKGKQQFFYPLKHRLLQRHAISDGWDLQTITKRCWNCGGTGKHWTGEECYRCDGTGIYSQRTHFLQRWKLGDRVYHCPVEERPDGEPYGEIEGRIEHHSEHIDGALGRKALIWLMVRYQPVVLLKIWVQFQRYRFERWLNRLLIRLRLREDDIPF